jgi:CBS domain-containing protein
MKSYQVKEMMVPLSEYATVPETASLLEAVKALKKAQAAYSQSPYQHRAILVFDKNNHFVGKLSQHDFIMALEPNYKGMANSTDHGSRHRLGFSNAFVESTLEQYHLWEQALDNLCEKALHLKVRNIMYAPAKSEFVNEQTTMDEAIHRLIIGKHHSLLVTAARDAREIVGVLRLVDVFEFVSSAMHECLPE